MADKYNSNFSKVQNISRSLVAQPSLINVAQKPKMYHFTAADQKN